MTTARIIAAVGAAALLAACGGGGGSAVKPAIPQSPAGPTGLSTAPQSTTFKYTQNGLKGATSAGAVQVGTIKVDVQMQLKNPTGL